MALKPLPTVRVVYLIQHSESRSLKRLITKRVALGLKGLLESSPPTAYLKSLTRRVLNFHLCHSLIRYS
ncbi:hypothetical protein kac68v162_gp002 [Nodularia phage vB_NspS-kac68v162]|uniref:Uncharacterized protein n=2 Tax=Ravarandavirus kac68v161 TaxID=2845690 RepID=A0A482MLA4_9CAUD|nr:hypothetical protein HWC13_gp002 [Nodularia phage vB_NspS-kac68v161]QBQ73652.1 hypothetical protein kac68v161_gp002 [Nodularia phage vB_NspS-kac68v161]QBQ73850.1 hypothetical protein kac68v162_gp002 [Nodularia phage vB_NspS-kac68v162]